MQTEDLIKRGYSQKEHSKPMKVDLEQLLELMRRLRDPEHGCPWDLAQDFISIVPHTLEEAYEVAHAIESDDFDALPGELGDLLFQVVFYAQLGSETGRFDFHDVIAAIADKLVSRHPHVFGDADINDADEVVYNWEARKAAERQARSAEPSSELDDVPVAMPALTRARKIQKRAARVGFDWRDASGARAKIDEELRELDAAGDADARADELGDLLFSVVNLARHLDIEPEGALRAATNKFERRFRAVEAGARARGVALDEATPEMLEALWGEAKSR